MLLPLRWLLYGATAPPTEEERGEFGGKRRKLPLRKRPRVAAEWSEAILPRFETATVADATGVTASISIGFVRTSNGIRAIALDETEMTVGAVTPRIAARGIAAKAAPRIGYASVSAEIDLFEHEIAMLMLS